MSLEKANEGNEVGSTGESIPTVSVHGMVSTAHPIATKAGVDILKVGGNAFDAAVAVAATLNVVEPMMSGIGGYGTILIYDAKGDQVRYLDSCGRIPAAVDSDVFRPPTPYYMENRTGPKSVSTPGNVNAWEALQKRYGRMKWKDLFQSAIKVAEEGFIIGKRLSEIIAQAFNSFPEHAKAFYGCRNIPLPEGDLLIQKDLSNSLKLIADKGARVVYSGEIGKAIDAEMRDTGGFLSIDDLSANRAEWWDPIKIDYKDYTVYTASPPSTAFSSLIILGMMSRLGKLRGSNDSTSYLHLFSEIAKHAYWCRLAYAGDPEMNPPPLQKLLCEHYWSEQLSRIDLNRAQPFMPPDIQIKAGDHTTHYAVADRQGNIVSATQTLGNIFFASRIMPKGTGIWLNDSLAFCTFEPKGNPMDAHAGRRKLSGDCPTIVMRKGKPWIAIGASGGHTIGQTIPQMIINTIEFGMNIQEAITAPRISFVEPNCLRIELGIPESVRADLKEMGHPIEVTPSIGIAHGLAIQYAPEGHPIRFMGGADPRGEGRAEGY